MEKQNAKFKSIQQRIEQDVLRIAQNEKTEVLFSSFDNENDNYYEPGFFWPRVKCFLVEHSCCQ